MTLNKLENIWSLQDAKAQLRKVVRLVESKGPQILTVHGPKTVKIIPYVEAEDNRLTDAELVKVLEKSHLREMGKNLLVRPKVTVKKVGRLSFEILTR
jgi:prevent-host-death family protein